MLKAEQSRPRAVRLVESPTRGEVAGQLLTGQAGAHELDRDGVLAEERVVEGAVGHLPRVDELPPQGADLEAAQHVGALVERLIGAVERPPYLGGRVVNLVADAL